MCPANPRRAASPQAAFVRRLQPAKARPQSYPSPTASLRTGFSPPFERQKNTFLTGKHKFNLSSPRRTAKSSGLAVQSGPSPGAVPAGRVGIPWGAFPVEWERSRPWRGCFARAAGATPGASHGERSAPGAKAGSSRGQAAIIIINPTSVNVA